VIAAGGASAELANGYADAGPAELRSPFPFIVGCGRSGTTLVRALFDAHPAVAVPNESYFPFQLARRRARYERAHSFDTKAFRADLFAHEWFEQWAIGKQDVSDALGRDDPSTFEDAIRVVYRAYAASKGKPRYGDKTPGFIYAMDALATMFPEAVFVHVVRDGRDVALSRLERRWVSRGLEHQALLWRKTVERGRDHGRRLGPGRYCEVRYEDLLDEPEGVLSRLCRFTGLDFDPNMLRYHESARELVSTLPYPHDHVSLLLPPTKGLRNWRVEMTREQMALFDELSGDALTRFGYERASVRATTAIRSRAALAKATWFTRRVYRRLHSTKWREALGE
jgi:hypothetical protein